VAARRIDDGGSHAIRSAHRNPHADTTARPPCDRRTATATAVRDTVRGNPLVAHAHDDGTCADHHPAAGERGRTNVHGAAAGFVEHDGRYQYEPINDGHDRDDKTEGNAEAEREDRHLGAPDADRYASSASDDDGHKRELTGNG